MFIRSVHQTEHVKKETGEMWELFYENITDWLKTFCTILAFVIPFAIYKINNKLHEYADPPWKRQENREEKS